MKYNDKPCCVAEAMRRVTLIDVGETAIGLTMLDLVFAEVHRLGLTDDATVRAELLKRVKVYNYVPPPAEDAYAGAVYREYAKWNNEGGKR